MIMVDDLKKEIWEWAREVGVVPKEIHVRKMKRKWGSCSSKGRLTFSSELLRKPVEVRTKAIVHELLHLKYPNHGRMFTALLVAYLNKKGIEYENIKL